MFSALLRMKSPWRIKREAKLKVEALALGIYVFAKFSQQNIFTKNYCCNKCCLARMDIDPRGSSRQPYVYDRERVKRLLESESDDESLDSSFIR